MKYVILYGENDNYIASVGGQLYGFWNGHVMYDAIKTDIISV